MTPAARPYAEALFQIARDRGDAPAVLGELEAIDRALLAAPHARDVLVHPGVALGAAEDLLRTLLEGASPLVVRFVRVLCDKRRLSLLTEIISAFRARVEASEGRVRARVQTARPLGEAEVGRLRDSLSRRLHQEVDMSTEVQPGLIGGVRVLFGDRVLDGTLAGRLAGLRRSLETSASGR